MHGLHYSSWQARQTVGDNQECQKSRLGQRVGRGPVRILNYLSSPVHWHALPWENPTTLNGISHTLSAWYVPSSWTALCGPLGLGNTMVPSSRPELKLRSYVQELRSEPGGGGGRSNGATRSQPESKPQCEVALLWPTTGSSGPC